MSIQFPSRSPQPSTAVPQTQALLQTRSNNLVPDTRFESKPISFDPPANRENIDEILSYPKADFEPSRSFEEMAEERIAKLKQSPESERVNKAKEMIENKFYSAEISETLAQDPSEEVRLTLVGRGMHDDTKKHLANDPSPKVQSALQEVNRSDDAYDTAEAAVKKELTDVFGPEFIRPKSAPSGSGMSISSGVYRNNDWPGASEVEALIEKKLAN